MMKNKKMGVLAVLVMLVAVTLNAVGGTYAKYISQYGVTDEARVAKWDFRDKSTNVVDLFQNSYTNTNDDTVVASSDAWKVIAPGTEGHYSYDVSGSAETNFKVSQELVVINNVVLEDASGNVYYDPIEFSTDGTTWMNADDFNAAHPATADVVYAANTYASVKGTIYWRWQFETGHDALDTELGSKAVANPADYVISAKISATVEQTQEAATSHPYVSVSNRLTDAQYAEAVALGYKPDYAVTTFNGKEIYGDVNEYTDETLRTWYNVAGVENYFYALNMTAPAGYKLINVSAGNKVLIDNTTGSDAKSDVVIINLRSTGSQEFVYKLVDATGNDIEIETTDADGNVKKVVNQSIDYSGLTFNAKA